MVCASSAPVILQTFRLWLLSCLKCRSVVTAVDLSPAQVVIPSDCHPDLLVFLVLEKHDAVPADRLLRELRNVAPAAVSIAVTSSSFAPYDLEGLLHGFSVRVPLPTCMPVILGEVNRIAEHRGCGCSESVSEWNGRAFTNRERQVMELLARGIGIKAISYELGISKYTVIAYRRSLYLKTGARSLQQLTLFAALYRYDSHPGEGARSQPVSRHGDTESRP